MKYFIFLILLYSFSSCSNKRIVDENIYTKFINSDLNYFFENNIDDDLFIGLKSIIIGDYSKADNIINQIIPSVSDSLKKNLYNDLAYISFFQKNWAKGNEYLQLMDSSLNENSNPYYFFSTYPKESFSMLGDTASVSYDGFYIQGKINNRNEIENIILDTGASPSIISFSLAKKYNLQIDSTKVSGGFSGFGMKTKYLSSFIKHLKIEDVELFNIPVLVISDDMFKNINLKGQFILGLTEISFFDCVEFDYPENKFMMIKKVLKNENIKPNFAILGLHLMINYSVNNEMISGFIDTGSPSTNIFISEKWNPKSFVSSRTEKITWGKYSYTVNYYNFPLSYSNCLKGNYELPIIEDRIPYHRFKIESLVGKDIWSDKKMVIDFKNKYLCFY